MDWKTCIELLYNFDVYPKKEYRNKNKKIE